MDINDLRSFHTVLSFLCFVIIAVWAYSSRVKRRFEEAANLPFTEDDEPIVSEGARSRGTQS